MKILIDDSGKDFSEYSGAKVLSFCEDGDITAREGQSVIQLTAEQEANFLRASVEQNSGLILSGGSFSALAIPERQQIIRQLGALDSACGYNRGLREVILAFGTLTKLLNENGQSYVPDTTGNIGIVKVKAVEDQAKVLRAQLAALG